LFGLGFGRALLFLVFELAVFKIPSGNIFFG
jgi:hypothetical protein